MKKLLTALLFIFHYSIFTLLTAQSITTVVGNTVSGGYLGGGFSGDGGPAIDAELHTPYSIAFDHSGNMYIADQSNHVIREVFHATGDISTVAGNFFSGSGYSGDGAAATAAELYNPTGIALDDSGNLYIVDSPNNIVREVDHSTGIINTVAGNHSYGAGYSGDGSPATAAELAIPTDIAIDKSGNIYISDANNNVIRMVNHSTSIISTVAGNHSYGAGYNGDGGLATLAELNHPSGVSVDTLGNLFIADYNNQVIRKVDLNSSIISTVAGNHGNGFGYCGDGGPATAAELYYPWGLKIDGAGNLFIADQFNSVIRKVNNSNGNISTIAGNYADGFGYSGDGGPATAAELYAPVGVAIDAYGNLFIADADNNVIREVNSVSVGVDKIASLPDEISIYPNPNNGIFTLSLSHTKLVSVSQQKIEIYNVFGEKVFESILPQTPKGALKEINLSSEPNGVYFIKIINENGSICKKVVIEK